MGLPPLALPQLLALLVAANVAAAVARHAWKRRPAPGVTGFAIIMACLALGAAGGAFELVSSTLVVKTFWVKVQYVATTLLPLAWLGFAFRYAGVSRGRTRRTLVVLAVQPVVSVALVLTNEFHALVWSGTTLETGSSLPALVTVAGPWQSFQVAFATALLTVASFALLRRLLRENSASPKRSRGLLLSAHAPWAGYFLIVAGPPLPNSIDLVTFVFTLTGLIMAWGLLHLHSIDLVPSAREAVVQGMDDALFVFDDHRDVIDCNSAAEEILGMPIAEIADRRGNRLFPDNAAISDLLRDPGPAQREVILEWGGIERRCEVRWSPLNDWRRRIRGHTLAIHDITPVRYGELFQQSKNALLIHDARGNLIDVNEKALKHFNYTRSEILQLNITALQPSESQGQWTRALATTLEDGSADFEADFRRKNGLIFPGEVRSSLIQVGDEQIVQLIVRDITARKRIQEGWKRAKEAAEAASFAKTRFLANMSHEIRTPMNAIIGMTEMVLATELDRKQRKFLTTVQSSADALMSLLNDILDASKIEAGKLNFEPVEFNLQDCLQDCINVLAVRAHEKGLTLACHLEDDVPRDVVADPGRLRQIVLNLVGNGLKFTERGSVSIHVSTEEKTDDYARLHFQVTDTGIGIPAEKIETIFDPFIQADNSTTREFGGTGLGLTIVSELVNLMNGRVWVESVVGKGSEFHFVAEVDLHEPTSAGALATVGDLKGMNALIVDDNAVNRLLFEEMLENIGMRARSAASAKEGFDEIFERSRAGDPYRLVILDASMPEMSGFDLAQRVQGEPEIIAPTFIIVTSAGERGDAARCIERGISAYLRKPIASVTLRDAILMAVGTPLDPRHRDRLITRHSMRAAKRPLKVLLADDNPVNQDMVVFMLEGAGHRVEVVSTGIEAVEAVAGDHDFDVVLMDAEMPKMDGLEATRTIRRREKPTGRRVPIIAMTAHAMKGDRQRCLHAGMDAYLTKPVRSETLLQVLSSVAGGTAAGIVPETKQPAADVSPDAVMDIDSALKLAKGRKNLLGRVAGVFLDDYPNVMNSIRGAVANDDYDAVRLAAHRLKGSLGTFAAGRARDAALRLESSAGEGDHQQVEALIPRLEDELATLRPALEELYGATNSQKWA